jgi:hypothetical protein
MVMVMMTVALSVLVSTIADGEKTYDVACVERVRGIGLVAKSSRAAFGAGHGEQQLERHGNNAT